MGGVMGQSCGPGSVSLQEEQPESSGSLHREGAATSKSARGLATSRVGQHPDLREVHVSAQPPPVLLS